LNFEFIPCNVLSGNPQVPSHLRKKDFHSRKKLLLDYKGIITRHPNDKDKYTCLVCQRAKAKKSNGKWYNCIGHIESHTHAISMRKLTQNETQVQPEGEQVEIDDEIYQREQKKALN